MQAESAYRFKFIISTNERSFNNDLCTKMASEAKIARVEATFCVSVVVKRAEKKCTVVKNALKRIPTCNTWEDLFNDAIIDVSEDDLSDDIVDNYSKIASISVSREPNGEAFYPENTEEISNTLDFDSNLKYVTVSPVL